VSPNATLRFRWAFPLALLVHLALYLPSLTNGFVFDDHAIVEGQPEITGEAPLRGVVSATWFHRDRKDGAIAYRPLALASLGLDVRLFGLEPAPLRAENLLWGAVGAALLGLVAAELGAGPIAATVAVALFSVHPVRSDVLLSVVGRAELLSFAAVVGALLLALRSTRAKGKFRYLLASVSGLALASGLLCKETAFVAPLLLAAAAFLRPGESTVRGRLAPFVPAGIAWAIALSAVFALRTAILGGPLTGPRTTISPIENKLVTRPRDERFAGAIALVPLASRRLGWPWTLVADYGSNAVPDDALRGVRRVSAGLAILLFTPAATLLLRRRAPAVSFGLAWALISYLPFANVAFPTAVLFSERLLFLPAAGIALALGGAAASAPDRFRRALLLSVLALLVAGAARVWSRIPDWRDDRALFAATVRDAPGNGRAWMNLAVLSLSRGDAASARTELVASLRADPGLRPRVEGMARHAAALGRADLRGAIEGALGAKR
jgi:hypothetical protein